MRRRRFVRLIPLLAIVMVWTSSAVLADSRVPGEYWPESAPIPEGKGCVGIAEIDMPMTQQEFDAYIVDEVAKNGVAHINVAITDEICFDSFDEYLTYTDELNSAEDPPSSSDERLRIDDALMERISNQRAE